MMINRIRDLPWKGPMWAPDDEGAGGGDPPKDATPPPADPPKDATPPPKDAAPPPADPPKGSPAPDWREMLVDPAAKKAAGRYESLDAVFKGIGELQRQISDRIRIPGKDADEQDVAKFRKAMGIPEAPDGYKIDLPEGMALDEAETALLDAVKPVAHEHNVPAAVLSAFVTRFRDLETQLVNEQAAQLEKQRDEAVTELKREMGKDYDTNLALANRTMKQLGGDDLTTFLNETKLADGGVLGNSPQMVRLFAKLGRQMSEDGGLQPVDRDEAQSLNEQMAELTNKAHEAQHRGDRVAMAKFFAERDKVAARLYGDEPIVGGGKSV